MDEDLVKLALPIVLHWSDHRLKYQFLKLESEFNVLGVEEQEKVWKPKLFFEEAEAELIEEPLLTVMKKTNATSSPVEGIDEILMYDGAVNLLVMKQELSISLQCKFNLELFPFDNQVNSVSFLVVNTYFVEMSSSD